ncbi:MAG: phosphatase PAP2 family protein, partial [Deltaproteobacteria bacterium]
MIARLLHLDELLFRRIGSFRPSGLVRVMRGLTHLGNAESWFAIGFFLLACGGQAAHYGMLLGTGALLATLTSQTLKRACCRPRPSNKLPGFVAIIDNPDAFSFPSGHAAAAFAVAVALA